MNDYLAFLVRIMREHPSDALTPRLLAVIFVLAQRNKPTRTRDIAAELGIPKPSFTRLGNHLVHLGYASKVRGGKDARDCWISATEPGRAFVARVSLDTPHELHQRVKS